MKLESDYRIWEATTRDTDASRPALGNVLVERIDDTHGLCVAADGFILAVVPCELDPADVAGLVPWKVMRDASTKAQKNLGMVLLLGQDECSYMTKDNWVKVPRVPDGGKFPDWRRIPPSKSPEVQGVSMMGIDPALYSRACSAIGAQHPMLTCTGNTASLWLIEDTPCPCGSMPTAPFAGIMPLVDMLKGNRYPRPAIQGQVTVEASESDLTATISELRARAEQDAERIREITRQAESEAAAKRHNGNIVDDLRRQLDEARAAAAQPAPTHASAPTHARNGRGPEVIDTDDTITIVFPRSPKEDVKASIKALGFRWAAERTWALAGVNGNKADMLAQVASIVG